MTMSRLYPKSIKSESLGGKSWALTSVSIASQVIIGDYNRQPLECCISLLIDVCLPVHFLCWRLSLWNCSLLAHVNSTFASFIYPTVFHLILAYLLFYTVMFHYLALDLPFINYPAFTFLLPLSSSPHSDFTYTPRMSLLLFPVYPDTSHSSRPSSDPTF